MSKDDGRGVGEALNETGPYGGIFVSARYRVMFTERFKQQISQQRAVQLTIDEPLQSFYAFQYALGETNPSIYEIADVEEVVTKNATAVKAQQFPDSFKYIAFPIESNKFMLRIENIGDRFDTSPFGNTLTINLTDWVHSMFMVANPSGYALNQVNFTEVSLTGNQHYSTVVSSKTNWRLNLTEVQREHQHRMALNEDFNALSLPQQYIRTFNVSILAYKIPVPPTPEKAGLPGWAIALISVGGVLVLAAISFLIYKKVKAGKTGTYLELRNNEGDASSNAMH